MVKQNLEVVFIFPYHTFIDLNNNTYKENPEMTDLFKLSLHAQRTT